MTSKQDDQPVISPSMSSAAATSVKQTTAQMPAPRRFRQFGLATLLLAMIPLGALFLGIRNYLDNRPIKWIPYSDKSLAREFEEGRIVLVSFRASWDLNSVINEQEAIETTSVKEYFRVHRIVPMQADWTEGSDEIKDALHSIEANSIPVIAIYSPTSPDDPIVLKDLVTEQQVLDALETARIRSKAK